MDTVNAVMKNRVSRRKFMAGVGAGVGATAAVALAAGCGNNGGNPPASPVTPAPTTFTDLDILNFALSLEYLGAEYYLNALTGTGVGSADAGASPGTVTGAAQVPGLTGLTATVAIDFAQDELSHIRTLRAAITAAGGTPVSRPAIDFNMGFTAIATAAKINGGTFNAFANLNNFLLGAFSFEDVDVTAYTGAAPLITAAGVLDAAAGIQAVEAYHAGTIRTLIVAADAISSATGGGGGILATANQISTVRATLGGGGETTLSSTGVVAATSANAIGYARTPDQVLHIVYGTGGGAGVSSGGFFPMGITGTIKTTGS